MNEQVRPVAVVRYLIGEWTVEPVSLRLWRDGKETMLRPTSMDVLAYLADRPGAPVTYEELLQAFWRGSVSSTNAVHKSIADLRHVFEPAEGDRYIETIPRRGYRLVAPVSRHEMPVAVENLPNVPPAVRNGDASHATAVQPETDHPPLSPGRESAEVIKTGGLNVSPQRLAIASGLLLLVSAIGLFLTFRGAAPVPPIAEQHAATQKKSAIPQGHVIAITAFSVPAELRDIAWFGDSVAGEIGRSLSQVPGFVVKHLNGPYAEGEVAKAGAQHGLHGQVIRQGNRVQVDVRLQTVGAQGAVWEQRFEEPIDALQTLQERITKAAIDALVVYTEEDKIKYMRLGGTSNPSAYLRQLEAHVLMRQRDKASQEKALVVLREVNELDPSYSDPYSCIPDVLVRSAQYQSGEAHETVLAELRNLADRAAKYSPDTGAEQRVRYDIAQMMGDLVAQEAMLRELIKLPETPVRRFLAPEDLYGFLLNRAGLFDDAKQYKWYFWTKKVDLPEADRSRFLIENFSILVWLKGAETGLDLLGPGAERAIDAGQTPSIDVLTPLVTLNAKLGHEEETTKWLEILRKADTAGLYAQHADLAYRAFAGLVKPGTPEYETLLKGASSHLTAGQFAFHLGDLDSGVAHFLQLNPFERRIFAESRWFIEYQIPNEVRADPRYQAMLETMGFGESLVRVMQAGVRELTPWTGIHLASDAPDKVVLGHWRDKP